MTTQIDDLTNGVLLYVLVVCCASCTELLDWRRVPLHSCDMIFTEILFWVLTERRQTMLFSATQTRKTEDLARISLKKEPIYVGVDDSKEVATVEGLEQVRCPK